MIFRLDRDGMFWNVLRVVNSIYIANSLGLKFRVRWRNSLYAEPGHGHSNTWLSYFKPVYRHAPLGPDPKRFTLPKMLRSTGLPRITGEPHRFRGETFGLKLPDDRHLANGIVEKHIRLRPEVQSMIDEFQHANFTGPVIGVHIRGRGRSIADGAGLMRHLLDPSEPIPFNAYFAAVDRALLRFPTARVFACSDSSDVLARCKERYGERVFSYDATLSEFGEIHCTAPDDGASPVSPHKLGLDILIEAYSLALCDFFVLGNSSVANFVLCKSPDLEHEYIYQPVQPKYIEIEQKRILGEAVAEDQLPQGWRNTKAGLVRFRTRTKRHEVLAEAKVSEKK